jgi:hypothetical protein
MDREQRAFLDSRLRKAVSDQPELQQLNDLLLKIGGVFVVPPNRIDGDVPALLATGFVMCGKITHRPMSPNKCHGNVAAAWRQREPDMVGIGTGYSLSPDKLWRQHSWGVLRNGLLETTEKRLKYFGILLQGKLADHFSANYN